MGGQTIRIELAYDGTRFAGFARQPDLRTVESVLRERLRPLVPDLRRLAVGGRTDRGVHATGQVVTFKTRESVDLAAVAAALEPPGEDDLFVRDLRRVQSRFDARHSARARIYAYFWTDPEDLHLAERLDGLVQPLVGRHDFTAYARDVPPGASTSRRLTWARVRRASLASQPALRFDIAGEAFLRRQVRVIVGTALRAARAGAGTDELDHLLQSKDRSATARSAPPDGLYLVKVVY